jgi:hypothetical protein
MSRTMLVDGDDDDDDEIRQQLEDETKRSRSTTAFCSRCGHCIGQFYNSWIRMSSLFYQPALEGSYSVEVDALRDSSSIDPRRASEMRGLTGR